MPNHVHLILTPSTVEALGRAMGEAHRRYTSFVNARARWSGHLFQGRYASVAMDEAHLIAAVRTISLNPVRARLVCRAEDWAWSSVRAHLSGEDDGLVRARRVLDRVERFGQRIADRVAGFGGSWTFILTFLTVLVIYTAINIVLGRSAWDPYPFILLNLFLSMLAAIQAPVIMMSQNRQDTKDRLRSELDFDVNRRAESEIQGLAHKLNLLGDKINDVEDLLRTKLS